MMGQVRRQLRAIGERLIIVKEPTISDEFFFKVRSIPSVDGWNQRPVELRTEDECWPWPGSKNAAGYGIVSWLGRQYAAHRVAFELANGPLKPDELACHHCDNPPCCNPLHLYAGTHADNASDRVARGRSRNGKTGKLLTSALVEGGNDDAPLSPSPPRPPSPRKARRRDA